MSSSTSVTKSRRVSLHSSSHTTADIASKTTLEDNIGSSASTKNVVVLGGSYGGT